MPALVSPQADALLDAERALLDRLAALLAAADADPATAARLAEVAANLSDLFLVVVVGEFNAGKSTVLNALFGEVVMEEGPVPTTDKITVLRHGDAPETHHRSPFVTERRLPAPFLQGLTLVDTPGTNSIIQEHQALTEDFVPRADLVVFVTSFDRPLSDSERTFLGFIRDTWGKQLVFVLNKADLADDANEDPDAALAQVLAHVREGTERLMGFTPKIFPVAARLALKAKRDESTTLDADPRWEASRFAAFETYLTDTLTDAHRYALKLHAPLDAARQLSGTLSSASPSVAPSWTTMRPGSTASTSASPRRKPPSPRRPSRRSRPSTTNCWSWSSADGSSSTTRSASRKSACCAT
ncbi:MAG: dynamin family protein, partial [Bacteroidota bacterium]